METMKLKSGVRKKRRYDLSHWELTTMLLPGLLMVFVFCYIPMFGIVIAFKDFKYNLGMFGSPWVGLDNFKYLFEVNTLQNLVRNTVGYNVVFILLGMAVSVMLAICLYRIKSRTKIKVLQNAMLLPNFISWIIVSYIAYTFLAVDNGIINVIVEKLGGEKISFYSEPIYWPFILVLFNVWKVLGFNTLIYYGSILDIDTEIMEAASLDGCSELGKIKYIILPHLKETVIILLILAVGKIFKGDAGLFYYLPKDSGALYGVTDVLDTYIMRSIRNSGNIGTTSAVALLQSVVGFVLVVLTNWIVKKMDRDSALF